MELDEFDVVTACIVAAVGSTAYYFGGWPLVLCAAIGSGFGYVSRKFVVRLKARGE